MPEEVFSEKRSGGLLRTPSEVWPPPNKPTIIGPGGLMGPVFYISGLKFSRHLETLRVYIFTALWLLVVLQFFIGLTLLLPLKLLGQPGRRLYIRLALWWDYFSQPAIMVVPFSWCKLTVWHSNWDVALKSKRIGNSLWMSNHGSRIDWLIGMQVGLSDVPRVPVRFIAEITTAFMPLAGWSRYLLDDIYLRRTFHRDAVNIKSTLASYKSVPSPRMLFFAPEGAIADVGNAQDAKYIDACEGFMRDLGRKPMDYCLTPRYKGLSVFKPHSPNNIVSATMVFVTPNEPFAQDMTISDDGRVCGGSLCTRSLRDDARVVPDIHTVFGGGLHVYAQLSFMELPADEGDEGASKHLRDVLLDDYERKDAEIAHFQKERRFRCVTSKENWTKMPIPHLLMNLTLLAYAALGVSCLALVCGTTVFGAAKRCATIWASIVLLHSISHRIGVLVSGHHRESLPGESIFKAALETIKGGLNHGGTKKEPPSKPPSKKAD